MKYINTYDTKAEYNQSEKLPLDISYIKDDRSVQFNLREVRRTADYLRFEVVSPRFSFSFSRSGIEYSPDFGITWISLTANTESPRFKEGAEIFIRGSFSPVSATVGIGTFSTNGKFNISGNPQSLLNPANVASSGAYASLFVGTSVVDTSRMVINYVTDDGSTNYPSYFYYETFKDCEELIKTPEIPAVDLVYGYAFHGMFEGCTKLEKVPDLLSKSLSGNYHYGGMFKNCTSLKKAPRIILPESLGTYGCFSYLFEGCSSLVDISAIDKLTKTSAICFRGMFKDCTSLVSAKNIIGESNTITHYCYQYMFEGCSSLTEVPNLLTSGLANSCYMNMFKDCISLKKAPEFPAAFVFNRHENNFYGMFEGCTSLEEPPGPYYHLKVNSNSGLTKGCFQRMFAGCTSLKYGPDLIAASLTTDCCKEMFAGCTSLERFRGDYLTAPCPEYSGGMFEGVETEGVFIKNSSALWTVKGTSDTIPATWSIPSEEYLTIEILYDDTVIKFTRNNIFYSIDEGETWTELLADTNSPSLNKGRVLLKASGLTPSYDTTNLIYGIGTFSSTKNFNVRGNISSMLFGDDFRHRGEDIGTCSLGDFFFGSYVVSAKNLFLAPRISKSSTTVDRRFYRMFRGCTKLVEPPDILITDDGNEGICDNMFYGCTSLVKAPKLSATTVGSYCYRYMFYGCTSLTEPPPILPANLSGKTYSYYGMFYGCNKLEKAVPMLATTISNYGCYQMYRGTKLKEAPELPATLLGTYTYSGMFYNCTSLVKVPKKIPVSRLTTRCFAQMFYGCTNLEVGIEDIPAKTTTGEYAMYAMYNGCTKLKRAHKAVWTINSRFILRETFQSCVNLEVAPIINLINPNITVARTLSRTFYSCGKLNYIRSNVVSATYPTDYETENNTFYEWVSGVSPTGVFQKNALAEWTEVGIAGVPSGWIVPVESYITFKVLSSSLTFSFTNNIYYSIDNGTTWVELTANTESPSITQDNLILFKGELTNSGNGIGTFSSTGDGTFEAYGNVMSLILGDNFKHQVSLEGKGNKTFYELFANCTSLTSAKFISLPATTLTEGCYCRMFANCTALTDLPDIMTGDVIANSTLSRQNSIFPGCSSITNFVIDIDTVADFSGIDDLVGLFDGCTNLENIDGDIANIEGNLDLFHPNFNEESLNKILDAIQVVNSTKIIYINSDLYNSLGSRISEITNKGWIFKIPIEFEDPVVKSLCVTNWGGNYMSGEILPEEAATVTTLNNVFRSNTQITKFNEFRYFTGITTLTGTSVSSYPAGQFYGCTALTEVTVPAISIHCSGLFRGSGMKHIDITPFSPLDTSTTASICCLGRDCPDLISIRIPAATYTKNVAYIARTGSTSNNSLSTFIIDGDAEASGITNFRTSSFGYCAYLTTIKGRFVGLTSSVLLDTSRFLTRESFVNAFLSGLSSEGYEDDEVTRKYIKLHEATFNFLKDEDIEPHMEDGWDIYSTISFQDATVKSLCVSNWGGGTVSGEITTTEAAAVISLNDVFKGNTTIGYFDELRYFTNLTDISSQFEGCISLLRITLPKSKAADNLIIDGVCKDCTALEQITILGDSIAVNNNPLENCTNFCIIDIFGSLNVSAQSDDFLAQNVRFRTLIGKVYGFKTIILSSLLSVLSVRNVLKNLTQVETTEKITIPWSAFISLSDDEIAEVESKGWIIETIIQFKDANVKSVLLENFSDKLGLTYSGEITNLEAATVTSLNVVFNNNTQITSFDEFRLFTGIETILASGEFQGCTALQSITFPEINIEVGNFTNILRNCNSLLKVDLSPIKAEEYNAYYAIGTSSATNSVVEITLPGGYYVNAPGGNIGRNVFKSCKNLTTLKIDGVIDFSGITSFSTGSTDHMFYNCISLTTIIGTVTGIIANLDVHWSPLTRSSAMVLINGLEPTETSKKIVFKYSTYNLLSDADIAIATNKGWQVETTIVWEDNNLRDYILEQFPNNVGLTYSGEITNLELATITSTGGKFYSLKYFDEEETKPFTTFNEFRFFTGLTGFNYYNNTATGDFYGCTNLEYITMPSVPAGLMNGLFRTCTALKRVDMSPLRYVENNGFKLYYLFSGSTDITEIIMPSGRYGEGSANYNSYWGKTFASCTKLTKIHFDGTADLSGVTSFETGSDNAFSGSIALTTITGNITGIMVDLSISSCPLTRESALVLLNGLATVEEQKTITFSVSTYELLTAEDIAIATNKNWVVKNIKYDSKVEYLQSTPTARIDTGLTSIDKFEMKFRVSQFSSYAALFGNYVDENSNVWRLILDNESSSNELILGLNTKTNGGETRVPLGEIGVDHTLIASLYSVIADGVPVENIRTTLGTINNTEIVLFARDKNQSSIPEIGTRIYYFRAWKNGALVRDFIPVRVGQVGYMYDKVSNTLFSNAGSGTLNMGQDII